MTVEQTAGSEQQGQQPPAGGGKGSGSGKGSAEPTFTQAEVERLIGERLNREGISDLRKKAEQFDKLQEREMTEAQREKARAEQAEKDRDEAQKALLRHQVANAKGIPEVADDLSGSTKEEMEASADRLLQLAGKKAPPSQDGGRRTPPPQPQTVSSLIRQQAGYEE